MALPIAVLVSGSGSNLQSLIDRIESGTLDADIRLVVSNNPDAYGIVRARNHNIPNLILDHRDFDSREAFDAEMAQAVRDSGAEYVILAGFMRLLTPGFLSAFPGRVVNIHPALLPSFPGTHGQRDAALYGVRIAGCTVHFVNEKMDNGPVIIQAAVPAYPGEDPGDLGERILRCEHRIYAQAVQWLAEKRLTVQDRFVLLAQADRPLADAPQNALVSPPLEKGF